MGNIILMKASESKLQTSKKMEAVQPKSILCKIGCASGDAKHFVDCKQHLKIDRWLDPVTLTLQI